MLICVCLSQVRQQGQEVYEIKKPEKPLIAMELEHKAGGVILQSNWSSLTYYILNKAVLQACFGQDLLVKIWLVLHWITVTLPPFFVTGDWKKEWLLIAMIVIDRQVAV